MKRYFNNKYRIKRNEEYEEMMSKLTNNKIFDSYRDMLMISAMLGYTNNKLEPIIKQASDGVLMQFFSTHDLDIMDLIAYSHTKNQNILNSDEKYKIFEEYSNGGFPILLDLLGIESINDEINRKKVLLQYYSILAANNVKIMDKIEF